MAIFSKGVKKACRYSRNKFQKISEKDFFIIPILVKYPFLQMPHGPCKDIGAKPRYGY